MTRGHMQKRFDSRLTIKLSGELRTELEAAAKQAGEELSATVRKVLVEYAARRVTSRGGPAVEQTEQRA
jgi:hypothetical protein